MKRAILLFSLLCFAMSLSAQNITVKGKVLDVSSGEGIPYATLVVKGTSEWTTSKDDGSFLIEAPANGTLSVSLIGYTSKDVAIDSRQKIIVELVSDMDVLSESVVIGYGVQQKKLITGSTVQVKGDDLTKLSNTSPFSALQSQSPGVTITQSSG